jgi:hypothetical protein
MLQVRVQELLLKGYAVKIEFLYELEKNYKECQMNLKGKVAVVTVGLNRVLDSLSWPFVHFLQCNRFFKKGNTHQGRFSALPGKGYLTI